MAARDYTRLELLVGGFVASGLAIVGYLAISLGDLELLPEDRISVVARFSSVGDLREGAPIKIAGVAVGKVGEIQLVSFVAHVELRIDREVALPADSIASIRTAGLLGESYVSLSPGGSERTLSDGDAVEQTEPAIDLTELLQKYAFGSPTGPDKAPEKPSASHEPADPLK
jgi:phospholipid/cholesterol/gamma-HCH transport system substrate-binding protein